MTYEAWNKITQTHDLFKKIIAPLKQHLSINFGYMIVFNDGSYYQIIEDLECLKKCVSNVKSSHIFCAKNVTTYFDEPYNFTIWPEEPTCPAMEIYKEHGMWNGITVSKTTKDHTELYWFTKENAQYGWHKWFVRNKQFLFYFIEYFINVTDRLDMHLNKRYNSHNTFQFIDNFKHNIPNSEYLNNEQIKIREVNSEIKLNFSSVIHIKKSINLSDREIEVLNIIGRGYNTKIAAQKLNITERTVKFHVEKIKNKSGLHFKHELIQLYEKLQLIHNSI